MKGLLERFGLRSRSRDAEQSTSRRSLGLRLDSGGRPASLDEQARSVEVVAATETDEVTVFDYDLGRVPEILLMSGMRMPKAGRMPLLDTHNRYTTEAVLGSARDLRIDGERLLASVCFSATDEGERAFRKVKERIMVERLWHSFKYECVCLHAFETGSEARQGIGSGLATIIPAVSSPARTAGLPAKHMRRRQGPCSWHDTIPLGGVNHNPATLYFCR